MRNQSIIILNRIILLILYKIRIRTSIRTFEAEIVKKIRTLSLGKKKEFLWEKKVCALRDDSVYTNAWSLFVPSLLLWVNVQLSELVCEQTRTYNTYFWGSHNDSGAKYPKIYYFGLFWVIFGYIEYCEWAKTLFDYAMQLQQ